MLLQTASYDDGVYNGLATETRFLSYSLIHRFNEPCIAIIVLADPTGDIIDKYKVASDAVYIGPGKANIEDPTGTPIFYGRIVKAERTEEGRCILTAKDWLSQLDDTKIDYDMREDLDPLNTVGLQHLRESYAHTDVNNATYRGPAYTTGANYYLYDDRMHWPADQFNGMNLALTAKMAGDITITTGPYVKTVTAGIDFNSNSPESCWGNDGTIDACSDNDQSYDIAYDCRVLVNASSFFSSVSEIRVRVVYQMTGAGTTGFLRIYDYVAPAWVQIGVLENNAVDFRNEVFTVPAYYNSRAIAADGTVGVDFQVIWPGGGILSYIGVDMAVVEVDCKTTGYSSPISISDTLDLNGHGGKENCLKVGTDLCAAATKIWEGIPYSIAREIYKHIDSAETPGTLITNGDTLYPLTCAATVEHTSGISFRHYSNRTRRQILEDLSKIDKAVFWIALGTSTVTWKSTFNNGAPTAMTDASVLSWDSAEYDYEPMRNKYKVLGVRIGDSQIEGENTDAGSVTDYGMTKNEVINDSGVMTAANATEIATALTARDHEVFFALKATLKGIAASTFRLGQEVQVDSKQLRLIAGEGSDKPYVITEMTYDSKAYRSQLTLLPRVAVTTLGFPEQAGFGETLKKTIATTKEIRMDSYMPKLTKEIWTNP